jgi:hypothetical protein
MDVSYFTCLDDIANAIDDLIALEDIYISATGDSDKPTVEPVPLKPSVDGIYDNNKRQVNSFGETSGYKHDSEQLVPKPVGSSRKLLAAGIVHAPLKGCFDIPLKTLSDHLGFSISTIGKGAGSTGSREEVLCAPSSSARAAFRGFQESAPGRLRPPSALRRRSHLVLASSSVSSLSPP